MKVVFQRLSEAIIRDAEGATHLIRIQVEQAASEHDAYQVARTVAHSPLVKTALAAGDPNWGRILAAVGYAPAKIDAKKVCFYFSDVCVVKNGALASSYNEQEGVRALSAYDIELRIVLGVGVLLLRY